jgi:hypothetical protein
MRKITFIFVNLTNTLCTYGLFVLAGSGSNYGVGICIRKKIALRLLWTYFNLKNSSASTPNEQLVLINAALSIPKAIKGDIAEFGCYKGVSSCALSIVAKATGRRLLVFDSFEGLPKPETIVRNLQGKSVVPYRKGDFRGSLDEVMQNVQQFGEPSVVDYIPGFFSGSLPKRENDCYALIFEDADLPESVLDIFKFAYPRLSKEGGIFFCHEARDFEVVRLFYDKRLWEQITRNADAQPPGLIGGGIGLPLDIIQRPSMTHFRGISLRQSCLGYFTN